MIWLLLLGMVLITFTNRYLFFTDAIRYLPSPRLQRLLSYSSYSVLTAIWAPIVFQFDGQMPIVVAGSDYLYSAGLAAILSFCRAPSLLVVVVSTVVFFCIRFY